MASMVNLAAESAFEDGLASRPKGTGLNSNVSVQGAQFHVQTEDLWPETAQIVSHVFDPKGRVIQVVRIDYTKHLGKANLRQLLPKVMTAHHGSIISKLSRSLAIESGNLQPQPTQGARAVEAPPSENAVDAADECQSGTFKVAPRVAWDRLVREAQRERHGSEPTGDVGREPVATLPRRVPATAEHSTEALCPWDLAVQSQRHRKASRDGELVPSESPREPAAEAYEAGLEQMHLVDKTQALACFARAVQLDPHNPRYRASLRHALDWLERFERRQAF